MYPLLFMHLFMHISALSAVAALEGVLPGKRSGASGSAHLFALCAPTVGLGEKGGRLFKGYTDSSPSLHPQIEPPCVLDFLIDTRANLCYAVTGGNADEQQDK